MKNRKISIQEPIVYPLAEEFFIRACGLDLKKKEHQSMMEMGLKVREEGLAGIDVNGLLSFYGPKALNHGMVQVDHVELTCTFFSKIPKDAVGGIYCYLLTAGDCLTGDRDNIMHSVYADIWGTSYVDAGLSFLEEWIKEDMQKRFAGNKTYLSDGFGPGYFGMDVTETKKFFSIMDGRLINVSIKESGVMIPQKTCVGLYFVYNRNDIKAAAGCQKCQGNPAGCQFCTVKNKG